MKYSSIVVVLLVFLGALVITEACSCMPVHPQEQYCQSDFVILARVRKETIIDLYKVYKVKIRKEFKMSEKARLALKSGRIQTALEGSMCGIYLEPGKLYLITGRIMGLQAHVSLCGFSRLWKDILPRQRKGFRLLYGKGCTCKISYFFHSPTQKDRCLWDNFSCQSDHGICLRSPSGQCHWSKSLDLKKCLKGDYKPTPRQETNPEPFQQRAEYHRENKMAANRIKYQHYRARREQLKTS